MKTRVFLLLLSLALFACSLFAPPASPPPLATRPNPRPSAPKPNLPLSLAPPTWEDILLDSAGEGIPQAAPLPRADFPPPTIS
ncbi:MAG: hypothetical protein HUU38_27075, partial [Anaerolineales bacterium]|nr:hypothetical protein [Anaerolineales bacterium]